MPMPFLHQMVCLGPRVAEGRSTPRAPTVCAVVSSFAWIPKNGPMQEGVGRLEILEGKSSPKMLFSESQFLSRS